MIAAAIHSSDPAAIMAYGAAVEVLRVAVNVGNSLGSSGIETGLAPSMTVGTGFFGRSSVGENLQPKHLVQWTRLAYNSDPAEPFGNFSGLIPWESPAGPVPPYPVASNMADVGARVPVGAYLPVSPAAGGIEGAGTAGGEAGGVGDVGALRAARRARVLVGAEGTR